MPALLRRALLISRASFALMISAAAVCAPPAGNPLFAGADPDAIVIDGALWVFPTSPGRTDRLFAWSSTDLAQWTNRGEILRLDAVRWAAADRASRHYLWAPAVVSAGNKYYLYYSVGPQNPTPSRIGVAVADRPQGPFTDSGRALLTGNHRFEAIDPMVFVDPRSGERYLYAGGSAGARLRIFLLKPDMVTIAREMKIDQPRQFTEGVFMHERNGIYYLSYSHGSWRTSDYSVHYSTAPSPVGPWTYRGVILTSDAAHQGPGHHAFVRSPVDGHWLIVYHRWERPRRSGTYRGRRSIAIERIDYAPDGTILPIAMTGP